MRSFSAHAAVPLLAFAAAFTAFAASSCESAPFGEILAGKACSPSGECAPGYECNHATNVCVQKGTLAGSGGASSSTAATGSNVATTGAGTCMSISDCPKPKSPCETPVCLGGQCGTIAVVMGTALPPAAQTPGDCKVKICDGAANVVEKIDNTNVPVDGTVCTADTCTAGVPSNPPLLVGMPCMDHGGAVCNASGVCVGCVVPSDCAMLPPDDECQHRTCNASGQCGQTFAPAGTAIATQTKGNCKKLVCDGSGAIITVADPTNLPNDGNDCTTDTCVGTTPTFTPVMAGTPCMAGVCDSTGHCVGCTTASSCSGTDTFCGQRTCTNNVCGYAYASSGAPLPAAQQTPGDCQKLVCNGSGGTMSIADNTDVPTSSNPCVGSTCVNGTPQHPPAPLDAACTSGGIVCNGAGTCVACNSASQCSNQGSVCQNATCMSNTCGLANIPAGMPAKSGAQTVGTCQVVLCDGNGNANPPTADNTNLPVDGNPCTFDICTNGVPSNPPAPAGTACGTGGTCDGAGHCTNGTKTNGTACAAGTECSSGYCVDGVCCASACAGLCMGCSMAVTGAASGTCAPVPSGQDPLLQCSTTQTCNGSGACAFTCGQAPAPPPAACPAACTGGCSNGKCIVNCNASNQCASAMINCPPGFACEVQCGTTGSCTGAVVTCPDRYTCAMLCTGDCQNAKVQCGTGTCNLQCGAGGVCGGTQLLCGGDTCSASCNGATTFPSVTCGTACACTTCQLANGQACTTGAQCQSGNCPSADGVCCDQACTSTCTACLASKTGGTTGKCGFVTAGIDPNASCTGSATCNGMGACTLKPNGATCANNNECQSGFCPTSSGVCCATACNGTCQSCAATYTGSATGTCGPILSGLNPYNQCMGTATCNGMGACTLAPDGTACTSGTQCQSGFCPASSHVCCNQACTGFCTSCLGMYTGGTDGTCGFDLAGTNPQHQCAQGKTCNGMGACQ